MRRFLIYLKGRPLGMASVIVILLLYIMMFFAEFVAPYGPTRTFPEYTSHPPNLRFSGGFQAQEHRIVNTVNWQYVRIRDSYSPLKFFAPGEPYRLFGLIPMERRLFITERSEYPIFLMGTDTLGRDLFSRIIYGARISLTIGFIATALSMSLAIILGGPAGFFGGKTDWVVMRMAEFLMLIPGLYLILFLRSLLSSSMDTGQSFMVITLILSLVGWPGSARTLRGMIHAIKREDFIQNAQLEMIPWPVIVFRHIIPQIASLLIVSIALSVPGFIMTETALSYLGIGIADPAVSWGSLIRRDISTLANLMAFPWLLSPVWFLLTVTLAFNFLGDALRDYFDPYHTVFKRRKLTRIFSHGLSPLMRTNGSTESTEGTESAEGDKNTEANLLEVRDLAVSFQVLRGKETLIVEAVRGISYTLHRGEVLGIVGESGSGKSVSTQAIPGLLPGSAAVQGSARYEGAELIGLSTRELRAYRGKKIGMIFQEPVRSYDPLQNMAKAFLETFRNSEPEITKEESQNKAAALLAEVGLPDGRERLSNFPHQFSGGQLQRIGIALALAQGCELLVADEPTTALDVTIQRQIINLLKALKEKRNLSIIYISHDIDLVAELSDRILVMYGGLVMEEASSQAILTSAAHPYTRALLEASPRFGSHYSQEKLKVIPGRVADPSRLEPGCPFAPRCALASEECRQALPSLSGTGQKIRCIKGGI